MRGGSPLPAAIPSSRSAGARPMPGYGIPPDRAGEHPAARLPTAARVRHGRATPRAAFGVATGSLLLYKDRDFGGDDG